MCLYTDALIPSTASADILVYKLITRKNKSAIQEFQYTPNTLYRLRKKLKVVNREKYNAVNKGFHSYRSLVEATKKINAYNLNNMKIVKFYIPKGARFIYGDRNEVVSTSIRSGNLKALA